MTTEFDVYDDALRNIIFEYFGYRYNNVVYLTYGVHVASKVKDLVFGG